MVLLVLEVCASRESLRLFKRHPMNQRVLQNCWAKATSPKPTVDDVVVAEALDACLKISHDPCWAIPRKTPPSQGVSRCLSMCVGGQRPNFSWWRVTAGGSARVPVRQRVPDLPPKKAVQPGTFYVCRVKFGSRADRSIRCPSTRISPENCSSSRCTTVRPSCSGVFRGNMV